LEVAGSSPVGSAINIFIAIVLKAVIETAFVVFGRLRAKRAEKEIQQPTAVVILGGIVASTFLNMIVIPALYLKYGRSQATARAARFAGDKNLATATE
jgi:hypothetical protein